MDYKALGQQVRRLRKMEKLTQHKLCDKVDISVSFLGHIERGTRKASLETIISIATALGVTPNDLLRDSIAPVSRESNYTNEFIEKMRALLNDMEESCCS